MPLNWRKCSGIFPCVRRVANVGVVAVDGREQSAEDAKANAIEPLRRREKQRRNKHNDSETQRHKDKYSVAQNMEQWVTKM